MKGIEAFDIWAPNESIWSRWAKPILFAESRDNFVTESNWPNLKIAPDGHTAIIVDLPGEESVRTGMALAVSGYRPVPLYNSASSPSPISSSAAVNVEPIKRLLLSGATTLARLNLPPNAPPAFLLDANRGGTSFPTPGKFDNRSVVFPQDFPSANFLLSHGIHNVVLFLGNGRSQPRPDLAHILVRWQEAKIRIFFYDSKLPDPQPVEVKKPSNFRSLWYCALALVGLRRNSAGGFGSIVPEVSSGGGGYRGYG